MPAPKLTKSRIIYFLFNPLILAFYFWIGIQYFTPNYFHKYKSEIIDNLPVNDNYKVYSHDMDGDDVTERICTLLNRGSKIPVIAYYDINVNIINQWNLKGNWLLDQKLYFGDNNNNSYAEAYCITRDGDSLFLNGKELLLENGLDFENRFIIKTSIFNDDQVDAFIAGATNIDINGDGAEEFVFTIFSGFSNQPRNTFAYDLVADSLIKSPQSASGFSEKINYMDINGDGIDEITGFVSAVENIHYSMPYTDSSSWLMVLNPSKDMDFLFPPIRFDGAFGAVNPVFYSIDGSKYIVSKFYCKSVGNETNGFFLQLFDDNGKMITEKFLSYNEITNLSIINPNNGDHKNIFYIDDEGNIYTSDTSLTLKPYSKLYVNGIRVNIGKSILLDVDNDGEEEIIFMASLPSPDKLIIFRSSLKESTIIDLPQSRQVYDWHITLKQRGAKLPPIILLQAENNVYQISYGKSPYYLLKYPVYFIVYILLLLIFWGLQKLQNIIAQYGFETEKKLMRQQMALSKRQLEPHFMLNTLNNIGYMFSKENKEDAQYYFGRFASLIHRGLKYADQIETSLFEELEFVKDYLILQKRRFDGDIDFSIESDSEIDLRDIKIPHSLIFIFIDNAVKHGLRHKISDRKISIQVIRISNNIQIVITDNGIGRKQSNILKTTGTGKGLSIVANIIEGYNKLNNRSISYSIKDLVDNNGEGVGTEVKIMV